MKMPMGPGMLASSWVRPGHWDLGSQAEGSCISASLLAEPYFESIFFFNTYKIISLLLKPTGLYAVLTE